MTSASTTSTVVRNTAIGASAATVVAGGIFALMFAADTITLVSFDRGNGLIDVTGQVQIIPCTLELTSVDPIMEAGCTFAPPTGVPVSCSNQTPDVGTVTNGFWSCNLTLPANSEGGNWDLVEVFARDKVAPGVRFIASNAQIVADSNITCDGAQCSIGDLRVLVTSSTPDATGPAIGLTTIAPNYFYQIRGAPALWCENTSVTDASGVLDSGCEVSGADGLTISSCSQQSASKWGCSVSTTVSGDAVTLNAFARDTVGNRTRDLNVAPLTGNTGGLSWQECTRTSWGNAGVPLGIDVDSNGDAWSIGEFSTNLLIHIDKVVVSTCESSEVHLISVPINGNIYWYQGVAGQTTVLAEGMHVDDTNGVVYFTQGGCHLCSEWECNGGGNAGAACVKDICSGGSNDTLKCYVAGDCPGGTCGTDNGSSCVAGGGVCNTNVVAHARVGEYTPGSPDPEIGGSFRMFDLPGVRNEATGVVFDEYGGRDWIFVAEAGFERGSNVATEGAIMAFKPSIARWSNTTTLAQWPTDVDPELCSGAGGDATPDDGCFQRFQLPTGAFWPAGLWVSPTDGAVWFADFWGTNIGRLDPVTGAVKLYPSPDAQPQGPVRGIVGSGPWSIHPSADGEWLLFTEYFDNDIVRFDLSRWNDDACLSLVAGENPCMEELSLTLDDTGFRTHSFTLDSNGTAWISTEAQGAPGVNKSHLHYVPSDFSAVYPTVPSDFTPDYNPNGDWSHTGIAIADDGEMWVSHSVGQVPLGKKGFSRFVCTPAYACSSYNADCGTPDNGCGVALASCGTCGGGDSCGGGGTPWVCGQ